MIDYKTVQSLGLDEKEARLYLAALVLGETTIIPLTREAKLSRTTGYIVCERLIDLGLLSCKRRGAHLFYSSSSPEKLHELAVLREENAKRQKQLAEKIVPTLTRIGQNSTNKPKVQHFIGKNGIRAIFDDLLTSGMVKDYYIGSVEIIEKIVGESFMKFWIGKRVAAGIFSYGIRILSQESVKRIYKPSRRMMREIRFAPKGFEAPLYTMIYGDKVAFISGENGGFGLIIESPDFSKTQKQMFDVLWKCSRKSR
jgi:sugar-specific transcriptional regulator TrmB